MKNINLREKLIEAVSKDTGWEESAVHMVDNVILPVLAEHLAPCEHTQIDNVMRSSDEDVFLCRNCMTEIRIPRRDI